MKIRKNAAYLLLSLGFLFTLVGCSTSAFFFYPTKELTTYPSADGVEFDTIHIPVGKRSSMYGWFLKPPKDTPVLGTILHFHGNAANVSNQYKAVLPLVAEGFQAIVFDYRGYGESKGKPNQQRLLEDGLAAVDYTTSRRDVFGGKIILFGQSLGGHLACVVGDLKQGVLDGVVIEGAFTGHEEIAQAMVKGKFLKWVARLIVPTKYDGIDHIQNINIPKVIIHSSEDEIIPIAMGEELYNATPQPKSHWWTDGPHIAASSTHEEEFVKVFLDLLK